MHDVSQMWLWLAQQITDLVDLAVVLPIWLILAGGLAWTGWRRAAVAWLGVIAAALGAMLLFKLVLLAIDALAWLDIRSPSGHTVSATLLGGGLFSLVTATRPYPLWRGLCAALLAGLLVGISRVLLGDHTVGEVVLALPIGMLGATALLKLQGRAPPGIRLRAILLIALLAAVASYGAHLRAEEVIARLVLTEHGAVRERRNQLRHPVYQKPELLAEAPNQVWSWDITKLMGPAKWSYFYLYVIPHIFSRRVVGWCVADAESATLFKALFDGTLAKHAVLPGQQTGLPQAWGCKGQLGIFASVF